MSEIQGCKKKKGRKGVLGWEIYENDPADTKPENLKTIVTAPLR